jgi:hypothetical protein
VATSEESGSLLKKRTKKLLPLMLRTGDASCALRWGQSHEFLRLVSKDALC